MKRTFEKDGGIKYVDCNKIAELLEKEGWSEVKPKSETKVVKAKKSKKVAKDDNSKDTD